MIDNSEIEHKTSWFVSFCDPSYQKERVPLTKSRFQEEIFMTLCVEIEQIFWNMLFHYFAILCYIYLIMCLDNPKEPFAMMGHN